MRSFEVKVNRKARRAALRGALSAHAANGTLAILDGGTFAEPSTKPAARARRRLGQGRCRSSSSRPTEEERSASRSATSPRVARHVPAELEVAAVVWARALLVTEAALALVQGRAAR